MKSAPSCIHSESQRPMSHRTGSFSTQAIWVRSALLLGIVLTVGSLLGRRKYSSIRQANAATAKQPEPMESIVVATAKEREHRETSTAIGTVLALQSVTLRNEVAGTIKQASLNPGDIVEAGTVLVAMDVSVEEAEL